MRQIFAVGLLFLLLSEGYTQQNTSRSAALRDRYDHREFMRSNTAHQRIDVQNIDTALLNAAIFHITNQERDLSGLPLLKYSVLLEKIAARHSGNMVRLDFFSHSSPVRGEKNLPQRLSREGIENTHAAENIADVTGIEYENGRLVYTPLQNGGYFSYSYRGEPILPHTYLGLARKIVRAWMNSDGHRKNILNPRYKYVGVGAVYYRNSAFFNMDHFKVTQIFTANDRPLQKTPRATRK